MQKLLFLFEDIHHVIIAEELLSEQDIHCKRVSIPKHLSQTCGFALEIEKKSMTQAFSTLRKNNIAPVEVIDPDENSNKQPEHPWKGLGIAKKLDATGLSCPQPVVLTKNALEEISEGTIEVTVDTRAAAENVLRFVRNAGYDSLVTEKSGLFLVTVDKRKGALKVQKERRTNTALFIGTDTMGRGSDELGRMLLGAFFQTLLEMEPRPRRIIFMNTGVKLTAEGSGVLEQLTQLEKSGSELLVCGTCLDFFRIKDRIRVGRISNMFEITGTLLDSEKIITV